MYRRALADSSASGENRTLDRDAGLVNGRMARVAGVEEDRVQIELKDGATIAHGEGHPSLRFLDHAWATTIHSFQGRAWDLTDPTHDPAQSLAVS